MKKYEVEQIKQAVIDIIWMARRYSNGRATYAPGMFNEAYDVLRRVLFKGKPIDRSIDITEDVVYFPYSGGRDFSGKMSLDEPIGGLKYKGKPRSKNEK